MPAKAATSAMNEAQPAELAVQATVGAGQGKAPSLSEATAGPAFSPAYLRLQREMPNPLPRVMAWVVAALVGSSLIWSMIGQLDIIAVAEGRLVSKDHLKVVQPGESGVLRDVLVREGQAVTQGQVLLRFDPQISEADRLSVQKELAIRRLQLMRIDAQLQGRQKLEPQAVKTEFYEQSAAQLALNLAAQNDALQAEIAALQRAKAELEAAGALLTKLVTTEPLLRQTYERNAAMLLEGYVTRQATDDAQRELLSVRQEIVAQRHTIAGLKAAVEQGERRVAQVRSSNRQSLATERAQVEVEVNRLTEELNKQQYRQSLVEIRAPRSGVVKDLAVTTPGAFIQAGAQVLSIVPSDEVLQAEVLIKNEDVAFVKPGQTVQIKVASYPYSRYGMAQGVVERISPDASEVSAGENGRQRVDGRLDLNSTYRARITLDQQVLPSGDQLLPLFPGLLVTAEIHLGQRSVMRYLLSPVTTAVSEFGRER